MFHATRAAYAAATAAYRRSSHYARVSVPLAAELSAADGQLASFLARQGQACHEAAGAAEEDVAAVLKAMRAAGVPFARQRGLRINSK